MSKGKSKKKVIAIVTVSVLALLLCSGAGFYLWYSHSPLPTAIKMMSAFQEKDFDALLDCIEPETAQKIKILMHLTGISTDDLMDRLLSFRSDDGSYEKPQTENRAFKFAGYEQNGDTARISLRIVSDGESTSFAIPFVRISGTWYLSFG